MDVVNSRVSSCRTWIVEGRGRSEILQLARAAGWNADVRTVDRYLAQARASLVDDMRERVEISRAAWLEQARTLLRTLEEEEEWNALVKLMDSVAKVEGLLAPQKVEVRAQVQAVPFDVGQLDEEGVELLDRLLAKLEGRQAPRAIADASAVPSDAKDAL